MITRRALLGQGAGWAALAAGPARGGTAEDPLRSIAWGDMQAQLFGKAPAVFDDRVTIAAPVAAEDAFQVPFLVDAGALGRVQRILVFAELNPIPLILDFTPGRLAPLVATRFKIQQATPLRAAALDLKGTWHVAGQWVDAMGGGCTTPALAHGEADWTARLGETEARVFDRGGRRRVRLSIRHPMDTGLAAGIPAFFIEKVTIEDAGGVLLGEMATFEPVSENPLLTFEVPAGVGDDITVTARDNNGNIFRRKVALS